MARPWRMPHDSVSWNKVGIVVLALSVIVNVLSIGMNMHHHDLLVELSPGWLADNSPSGSDIDVRKLSEAEIPEEGEDARSDDSSLDTRSDGRRLAGACGGHPHDAMLYLFDAFVVGAAVMWFSSKYPQFQMTVVLFVLGFFFSLIVKGGKLKDKMGVFGTSWQMWIDIDPHLLLFTLLPALLAGDAMTIDTSVAKRVAWQCLFLAGPGVCIGGFGTALFLMGFLGWEFPLALCTGAILCATDPVAVVALLKELGASPIITVQIQGESLLNDGTAIVLYLISYDILKGNTYDFADICEFLIKKALMAWALGLFIGYFFFSWIRASANKLDHNSGMIQIILTLACAYWSFIFVEGVLTLSGVLATVASSLVLANHMWPYIVSEESMHHVWHTFESLGNIVIFFLAGSITGYIVVDIDAIDYLRLIVIYIWLVCLRGVLMFASRPILRLLSPDRSPVSWEDATLMTWGGLRGAVGLALAIQVNNGRAPHKDTNEPQIDHKDAERLLFYTAGVAFLTTTVNATTAPKLVAWLGITSLPQARHKMLEMFHDQLVLWSQECKEEEVTNALKHMLEESEHDLHKQSMRKSKTGPVSLRDHSQKGDIGQVPDPIKERLKAQGDQPTNNCMANQEINRQLKEASDKYNALPKDDLHQRLLGDQLSKHLLGRVDDMIELVGTQNWVDEGMAKVVNSCFYDIIFTKYWHLIEEGSMRPGSQESEVLFTSVRVSMSPYQADLKDFDYVMKKLCTSNEFKQPAKDEEQPEEGMEDFVDEELATTSTQSPLNKLVSSSYFGIVIIVGILLNSICVVIEEIYRKPGKDIDKHAVWIVLDGFWTVFFIVEFILKFGALKCEYWKSKWNLFDFFLVSLGIFGFIMSMISHGKESELAGKTRIIRVARVLRTLRFLRIFRVFHARMSADKYIDPLLAKHMKKVVTLDCFIRAHVMAQMDLVKYFGGNGQLDESYETEMARCILQSQIATYKALCEAADTQEKLGVKRFTDLQNVYQRRQITESLQHWIEGAHADGAVTATEAHAILHPLHHEIAHCCKTLADAAEGVVETKPKHGHGHGHGNGDGGLRHIASNSDGPTMVETKSPASEVTTERANADIESVPIGAMAIPPESSAVAPPGSAP